MKKLTVLFLLALISVMVSASQLHRSRSDSRLLETAPQDALEMDVPDFEESDTELTGEDKEEPISLQGPEPPAPETSGDFVGSEIEKEPETSTGEAEEMQSKPPEAMPQIFSDLQTAVVSDFSQLKAALEGDNGITTVYFGADITMTGGIRINPKKTEVVISGQSPQDSGITHTLTDLSSLSFYSTIYVDAAGTGTITVRDLNINGKNYYGPISIYDMAALSDIELIYERVSYNGPQLGYHRRGTIRIKDCTANIHGGNGGSPMQEFAESKQLIFEGTNVINTETTLQPVFRHPTGGVLQITDDSSLTLVSANTSTSYGILSTDLPIYDMDIIIGERAELSAEITGVMSTDAFTILGGMTINEGGTFKLKTTKAAGAAVLKMDGALTVSKEARFIVDGYGGASYPVLKATGEIYAGADSFFHIKAESAYSSLISLSGGAFVCDDPSSVILQNPGRTIMAESAPGRVFIKAAQVNYWDTVTTGGLDEQPLYRWQKQDGSGFVLDGTLAAGTNGDFTGITGNYTPGDLPGIPPDAETFSMKNARTLAFGRLPLSVIEPNVKHAVISGATESGAVLRATFYQAGISYEPGDVIADSSGIFHISAGTALLEGTQINVMSNWNYLTVTKSAVVTAEEGKLEFYVPEILEFYITKISAKEQRVKRLHHGWGIIVSDERESGGFTLRARLEGEMTPDKPELPVLEGVLIFVGADGTETVLKPGEELLIAAKAELEGEDGVYPVIWDEDKGILLSVKPGAAYADTKYTAEITWLLADAP